MYQDIQEAIEKQYSKKNVARYIKEQIQASPEILELVPKAVKALQGYLGKQYKYESKNQRIREFTLLDHDLEELVYKVLCVVLPISVPTLLTQVVGQLSGALRLSDKGDGAKLTADFLAAMVDVGYYTIIKESDAASLKIKSDFQISQALQQFITQTKYLPPMVCAPRKVRTNYDSGYLTQKDSLILGHGNFHEGNICLDSINKFNQIPLSLDVELLKTYSEVPKCVLDDPERKRQWEKMVTESYQVYTDLVKQGNQFWLTHKVDKRGRTYACGHHVNSQGNSFRKAIINFYEEEFIEGVPGHESQAE